jgi:hypothetical protein
MLHVLIEYLNHHEVYVSELQGGKSETSVLPKYEGSTREYGGVRGSTKEVPRKYEGSTREYEGSTREYEGSTREYEGSTREYEGSTKEVRGSTKEVRGEYEGSTRGVRREYGKYGSLAFSPLQSSEYEIYEF